MNVADSHVFHGAGWQNPYRIAASGKGIYIYDTEGKRYLDAIAGTHVVSIGHGVEEVVEAIAAQARKLTFVNKSQFTTQVQEELAHVVTALAPTGLERVTFPTGGSVANELALLVAQMYHKERGKPRIRPFFFLPWICPNVSLILTMFSVVAAILRRINDIVLSSSAFFSKSLY